LQYLSPDILKFLGDDSMDEVEYFKEMVQGESLLQLYIAAQSQLRKRIVAEAIPEDYLGAFIHTDLAEFKAKKERRSKLEAQMILGYRYELGVGGVQQRCQASVSYYEPVAYETTQYVLRTHGLDVVEKRKLKLGPYILDTKL